jgi:hypothetical protein
MQLLRNNKQPKEILIYWGKDYTGVRTNFYSLEAEDFKIFNLVSQRIKSVILDA